MSFILHTFSDFFYIEAVASSAAPASTATLLSGTGDVLAIARATQAMTMVARSALPQNMSNAYSEYIDGIAGVARLLRGAYLVVMMRSEQIVALPAQLTSTAGAAPEIRRLTEAKLIPFAPKAARADLSPAQLQDENRYMALLMKVLQSQNLYFARNFDITHSMQRIASLSSSMAVWERADERFFWNRYLCTDLIASSLAQWVVPLIHGFVATKTVSVGTSQVQIVIISRRNWHRTGRRYTTRGLDLEGHASNYVETEQLLITTGANGALQIASHVQTRGSIPLLWAQPITMRYTPKIVVDKDAAAGELAFKRHFTEQKKLYGRQILVNLINQKGNELKLERAYAQAVESSGDTELRYVAFDFHKECKKMKYSNLSRLLGGIADELGHMTYFRAELTPSRVEGKVADWTVSTRQNGAIRTNCMDCLDRTNVVQSVFARRSLGEQLAVLGIVDVWSNGSDRNQLINFPTELEKALKHLWADHGDALGVAYAGTGAMKSGFTRTGVRDMWGSMDDGNKSLRRYFINNLQDGYEQDALDLFLGIYRPHLSLPSPFKLGSGAPKGAPKASRNLKKHLLMLLFVVLLVTLFAAYSVPALRGGTSVLLFTVLFAPLFAAMMKVWGRSFTNMPRLREFAKLAEQSR